MPIYIYQPDAFDRLCQAEGLIETPEEKNKGYSRIRTSVEEMRNHRFCGFNAFLRVWNEMYPDGPPTEPPKYDWGLTVDGNGAIYGKGGWHRYTVRDTGEILFMYNFCEAWNHGEDASHMMAAHLAGFRFFPDLSDFSWEGVTPAYGSLIGD